MVRGGPAERAAACRQVPRRAGLHEAAPTTPEEEVAQLTAALAASTLGAPAQPVAETEPAAEPAPPAEPKAKAAPKRRPGHAQPRRLYVLTRTPEDRTDLLGVHEGTWNQIAALLPTGRLPGSGCHLKGFDLDKDDEANAYWYEEGWELPAPYYRH